jgi:hypothetical protein
MNIPSEGDLSTDPIRADTRNDDGSAQEISEGVSELAVTPERYSRRSFLTLLTSSALTFTWGLGAGYVLWGRSSPAPAQATASIVVPTATPAPPTLPHSFQLPIRYGQLGPWMINAGTFAYDAFVQVYDQAGKPLSEEQRTILQNGLDALITIDHSNSYFLLNFFWALGLVNSNPLLISGALVANGGGQIDGYASTGGWELAAKPIRQLFSSASLVTLDSVQQARLEEAVGAIYRPCCNNATSFPDCNHGMAMLGLLEVMAAQDADVDEMLHVAKMINTYWFPSQSQELMLYYQSKNNMEFDDIPAREAVGSERFSSRGFAQVHEWLVSNGKLNVPNQNGSSCGV